MHNDEKDRSVNDLFFHFNDYYIYVQNKRRNLFKIVNGPSSPTRELKFDCCHPEIYIEIFLTSNKRLMAHAVCKSCWETSDPLSYLTLHYIIEDRNNHLLEMKFYPRIDSERPELIKILNKIKNMTRSELFKALHKFYIDSKQWKEIENKKLASDNNWCQKCKIRPAQLVHHLNYDSWMHESMEDLMSVCMDCHWKIRKNEIKQGKT